MKFLGYFLYLIVGLGLMGFVPQGEVAGFQQNNVTVIGPGVIRYNGYEHLKLYTYFEYDFQIPEALLEKLETQGWRYEIEADNCRGFGLDAETHYFEGDWGPGKMSTSGLGFAASIRNGNINRTEPLISAKYSIYDVKGSLIGQGTVLVPNCINQLAPSFK